MTTKLPRALILLIGAFVFATAGFYIIKHQEVLESSENKNSYTSTVESEARIKDESSESLREILGQNLIVGIPGPVLDVNTEEILRYIKPAGIVLYRRNYETDFQFKNLIAQLQTISQEDTTLPYFIMLDEEPEGANRLGLLKNIFPLGFPNWLAIERDIGILADIGINVERPLQIFLLMMMRLLKGVYRQKQLKI